MGGRFVIDINVGGGERNRPIQTQSEALAHKSSSEEERELLSQRTGQETRGETTRKTPLGHGAKKYQQQIKGLGIATAWKTANAATDVANYTSGDQVANQQRATAMRMATYGATIAATGFNPVVIAGIVGNEVINMGMDNYKFNYDRKMERAQLTNSEMVLGDISYGRKRGGR